MKSHILVIAAAVLTLMACKRTPEEIAVTGVKLSESSIELTAGDSRQLTASVLPSNASNKDVRWTTNVPDVATVSEDGTVTALTMGAATITVTTVDGGFKANCSVTVEAATIDVESITLSPESLDLKEGDTAQLTVTVLPEDATDKTVEWSSQDSDVATVDQEGKVTAVSAGQTYIRALCGGIEANCPVTVSKIEVDGVTVIPSTLELMEGETYQLSASVSPADADQTVEWVSEDKGIATVDRETGMVTALAQGSTRIFARSAAFPDKQAWCELTITPDTTLKGISLSSTIMTLMVGESRTLEVVFDPPYALDKTVSWDSSDTGVAGVGENGNVTAFSEGTAVITATSHDGGHTASCTVTVSGSAGPQVYYWDNGAMYINGVLDPRNGAFDTDVSYLRKNMYGYGVEYYAGSLYSLEFWVLDRKNAFVLCKDRKPLFALPLTDKMAEDIYGFAIQGDYFAIITGTISGGYTLFRGDLLGNVESIPVTGTFIDMYYPKLAMTPDGSIHIGAAVKDAYWNRWIASYSIRPEENTFTENLIVESSGGDPSLAVDSEGNVYVVYNKYINSEVGEECVLLKNGAEIAVIDTVKMNYTGAIACHGTDVYIAVSDYVGKETRVFKGSDKLYTIKTEAELYLGDAAPLKVSPSGDVYLVLRYGGSYLYKNSELLYSGSSWAFDPFCVVE